MSTFDVPDIDELEAGSDAEGLGGWAKRQALTGLGYVGSVLGKPGRASRAAIDTLLGSGQHAQDIMAAIPFSDTLGLTRPEQEVGGSELLKNVTGYDPSKGNWAERNIVPFAVETLTDPSTFLPGAMGLTKAGKAAEKAGKLTQGFLPSIRAGERALLGGVGTGPKVASALEAGGELLRKVPGVRQAEEALSPLATKARSIFDVEAGPVANRAIQQAYKAVKRPLEKEETRAAREAAFDLLGERGRLASLHGEEPFEQFLRGTITGGEVDPDLLARMGPEAHEFASKVKKFGWEAPSEAERARGLAGKLGKIELKEGEDVLSQATGRAIKSAGRSTNVEAIADVIGKNASLAAGPIPAGHDVLSVLKDAGLVGEAKRMREGGIRKVAEALGLPDGNTPIDQLSQLLSQHQLSPEIAQGIHQLMNPRPVLPPGPIGQMVGEGVRQFKRGVYSIWPGSHVKNLFGGRVQSFLETGQLPVGGAYGAANDVMRNKAVDLGIADMAHLAPELQAQAIKKEAFGLGVIGQEAGQLSDEALKQVGTYMADPTKASKTLREIGKQFVTDLSTGGIRNPLGEQGAAVKMGKALNETIENNLRMGEFIGLRQKGWTPQAAANKVFQTHFDYGGGMSEAERRMWGSVATFPTFSRFNIPKQIGRAIEHPGQAMAMLRASENLNRPEQEGYVPAREQGKLSFPTPLGSISGLGLGVEDLGKLRVGPTLPETIRQTGQGFLDVLQPQYKQPLEWMLDERLDTGQKLSEMKPTQVGQALGLSRSQDVLLRELSGMLPTSRLASTVGRAISPETYEQGALQGTLEQLLPLATGARVKQRTPEETELAQLSDIQRAQEAQLKEQQAVRSARPNLYVPPDLIEETPENILELLGAYRGTGKQIKAARARQREEKEQ